MTLQKKLPFKDYTVINCSVAPNLSSPDMYRYFVLSLTAKRDNTTDTTLKQLADFVGEKESAYHSGGSKDNKKLSLNERFRNSGAFKDIILSRKEKSRNLYVFPKAEKGNYRRIKKEFRNIDLPIKLKGYLLQLFCLTEPHSLLVARTVNNIANTLGMAHSTVKLYNQILIEKDLLEETKEGFKLKLGAHFILDEPKNEKTEQNQQEDKEGYWGGVEIV